MSEPVSDKNIIVFKEIRRCYNLSLGLKKAAQDLEENYKKAIETEAKRIRDRNDENYQNLLSNESVKQSREELENVIYKLMTLKDYVSMLETMMSDDALTDTDKNSINFGEEWDDYCAVSGNVEVNARWRKLKKKLKLEERSISNFFSDEENAEITDIQKKNLEEEYKNLISEFGFHDCDIFFDFLMNQVTEVESEKKNELMRQNKLINDEYEESKSFNKIKEKKKLLDSVFNYEFINSENILDAFKSMLETKRKTNLYSSIVSHGYFNYNIEGKSLNKLDEIAEELFFPKTDFEDIPKRNIGYSIGDGSCLIHAIFPYLSQEIMDGIVNYVNKNNMLCPKIYDDKTTFFDYDGRTTFLDLVIINRNIRSYYEGDTGDNVNYVWYMRAAIAIMMYKNILQDNNNKEKRINNEMKDVLGFTHSGWIEANSSVMDAIADLTGYSIVVITKQSINEQQQIRLNYSVPKELKGKCYEENITNYNNDSVNPREIQIDQANSRVKISVNNFMNMLINGTNGDKIQGIAKGEESVIKPAIYKIDENTEQKIIFVKKDSVHYEPIQPNGFSYHELTEREFKSIALKKPEIVNYLNETSNLVHASSEVIEKTSNLLPNLISPISSAERAKYLLHCITHNQLLFNYFRQVTKSEYEKKIDEFQKDCNKKLNKMKEIVHNNLKKSKDKFQTTVFKTLEEKSNYINNARNNSANKILFIEFLRYFISQNDFYKKDIASEFDEYKSVIKPDSETTFVSLTDSFKKEYKSFTDSLEQFKSELQSLKDNTENNEKIKNQLKKNYNASINYIENICNEMRFNPEIKIDDSDLIKKVQGSGISSFFLSVLAYITPSEFNKIRGYVDKKNQKVQIYNEQKTVLDWIDNPNEETISTPEIYLRAYVVLKCLEIFPNDAERNNKLLLTILGYKKNENIDWINYDFFKLVSQTLEKSFLIVSLGTDKDKSGYCYIKSKDEDQKIELKEGAQKLTDLSQIEVESANRGINCICENYEKGKCICINSNDEKNFAPIGYDLNIKKFCSIFLPIDDEISTKHEKLLANKTLEVLQVNLSSKFLKTKQNVQAMALLGEVLSQNDIKLLKKYFMNDDTFLESKFEGFANIILKNICNSPQPSSFYILVLVNLYSKGIELSSNLSSKLFQIEPKKFFPSDIYDEFLNNFLEVDKEHKEKIIDLLFSYKENTQYVLPFVYDLVNNKFDESIYNNLVTLLEKEEDFNIYILNRKSIEKKCHKLILELNIDEDLKSDFIKKIHFLDLKELNFLEKIILNSGQNGPLLLKLPIKDFENITKEFMKYENFLRLNGFSERQIRNMENKFIVYLNEKLNEKNFNTESLLTKINMMQKNYLLISRKDKRDYYSNPIEYVEKFQKSLSCLKRELENPINNFEKLLNLCDDKVLVSKYLMALESRENAIFKAIIEIKKSLHRVRSWHRDTAKNFICDVFKSYLFRGQSFNYANFVSGLEEFIEQYRKNPRGFIEIMEWHDLRKECNNKTIYARRLDWISKKFTELSNNGFLILFYLCIRTFTNSENEQKEDFAEKIEYALEEIEKRNALQLPTHENSMAQSISKHI